jgi:UDP-2-acetamido-3-amino-2,3-dideoxy-glucuronate N-acetyltransferase
VSTLVFRSGVRAHLFVSWLHPFKEQKLVVVGDRRMAVFDDLESRDKLSLYSHQIEWVERVPVPHKADAKVIDVDSAEPLKEECKAFLHALQSREEPPSSGSQGLRVLQVLDACQRSLESGGQVTELDRIVGQPAFFVHPTSVVDERTEIGAGTKIWHFSHVMSDSCIGQNCNLGQNVVVSPDVVIGNNVKIQNNVSVYTGVRLEDDVFCGPSMVFTNVNNPRSAVSRKDQYAKTLVKRGATLGANSTIVCGHTIGRFAFVGAGAVVTKDIPDHAMVAGNPARIIGWACECGIKLVIKEREGMCRECGRRYHLNANTLSSVS